MKKIAISIFVSLIILVTGITFVIKNFSTSKVKERTFIVIKGYGENLYEYELPFRKGSEYIDIVHELEGSTHDPKKIYLKSGRVWKEVSPHARAFYDSTIKIDY